MSYPIQQLEGRDHYVVPMVMIVEGVLNGSGGRVFYPSEELRQSVSLWNGKPVVIYHPDMYGESFAGMPSVFNQAKVGTIFNSKFEARSLKAEAWLDVQRLKTVDRRVYETVQNRKMMEVSTGLLIGDDGTAGVFNGREYERTARNLVPDHLAILPDQIGACSIKDGAGLCRNKVATAGDVTHTSPVEALDILRMEW